jgi:hypothetical protein
VRKGLVLAGIGFGGVLLCGLAPEGVAAWAAPSVIVLLGAVAMAMPSEPDEREGGAADSAGVAVGGDAGGGGAGDDGGDGGGDGGGE